MENTIIGEIAKAEEEGAKRKEESEARARVLLAEAEDRASEILKNAETDCAILRVNGIKEAEVAADAAYNRTLSLAAKEAKEYADGILERTDVYVAEIVGRIVK